MRREGRGHLPRLLHRPRRPDRLRPARQVRRRRPHRRGLPQHRTPEGRRQERHLDMHHAFHPDITLRSDELAEASGHSPPPGHLIDNTETVRSIEYVDEYVVENGEWKMSKCQSITLWSMTAHSPTAPSSPKVIRTSRLRGSPRWLQCCRGDRHRHEPRHHVQRLVPARRVPAGVRLPPARGTRRSGSRYREPRPLTQRRVDRAGPSRDRLPHIGQHRRRRGATVQSHSDTGHHECRDETGVLHPGSISPAIHTSDNPCSTSPVTSSARNPTRGARQTAIGATTIGAAVHGSVRSPAAKGLYPDTICSYCDSRNTAPIMPRVKSAQ